MDIFGKKQLEVERRGYRWKEGDIGGKKGLEVERRG